MPGCEPGALRVRGSGAEEPSARRGTWEGEVGSGVWAGLAGRLRKTRVEVEVEVRVRRREGGARLRAGVQAAGRPPFTPRCPGGTVPPLPAGDPASWSPPPQSHTAPVCLCCGS